MLYWKGTDGGQGVVRGGPEGPEGRDGVRGERLDEAETEAGRSNAVVQGHEGTRHAWVSVQGEKSRETIIQTCSLQVTEIFNNF